VGENGFGPGSMRGAFSVGDTGGGGGGGAGGVVVVVVVVVVVSGASGSSSAQAAVNPTIPMIAAAPAIAGSRRAKRPDLMMLSYLFSPPTGDLNAARSPSRETEL
jgi:hypothetical protein